MEGPPNARKVFVADGQLHPYHDFEYERRHWIGQGYEVVLGACQQEADLIEFGQGADAIAFWGLDLPFSARVLEELTECRAIVRYGTGVDSVDLAAATRLGVIVVAPLGYCTQEVAEHATALLLTLTRRISFLDRTIHGGGWRTDSPLVMNVHRMATQTLGLIGFGRIAQQVATNMTPMVGAILATDPLVDSKIATSFGVRFVDLETLLENSDLVSVHVPLNDDTTHMLGARELAQMKKSAFLVNTSRGAVLREGDLVQALRTGRIAGAALDVFVESPLPADHPLRSLPNVVLTPHFSGNSEEAKHEMYLRVTDIVEDVLSDRWPNGVLNPTVDPKGNIRRQ